MSLTKDPRLIEVAKKLCRDRRKNSTPAEKKFWEIVRNRNFMKNKFYRQHPLFFDFFGKETFYIADFYCHEEKLVVEIDGGYHKRQESYDELRSAVINDLGIDVIRFQNDEVLRNSEEILSKLETYLILKHDI